MDNERFEEFSYLICGIHGCMQKIKMRYTDQFDLKSVHIIWLYLLLRHSQGLTASDLARHSNTNRSLVSREIDALIDKGLLCSGAKQGRRRYGSRLTLTEQGRELAQQIAEIALDAQKYVSRDVPPEDLAVFYRTLHTLYGGFERLANDESITRKGSIHAMNVKIICDSACDMKPQEAAERGVCLIPLKTRIDGVEYLDGVTITDEEFYEKLDSCKELPTTSQISPAEFSEACRNSLQNGGEAVVITLSSALSGTYQSACLAAEEFDGRVHVVDSENVTVGERILVEYALRLRDEGKSAAEITRELESAKKRSCLIARVDTLEYLMKGGRLSRAAAIAGTMLNLKPVLSVQGGVLEVLGKARGSKQGNNMLNQLIRERGVDFSMPLMLAYSGSDDAPLKNYIENSRALWEDKSATLPISSIGSTIGTHAGPGAIGVAFFSPKK